MALPIDQQRLLHDLCAKLKGVTDQAQLIAFMAEVMRSLLRRAGDAEFRAQVQDSFSTGLAGRDWPDQVMLARGVLAVVIAKRPEIAKAWQSLHDAVAPGQARRAADRGETLPADDDDLPDLDGIEIELLEEAQEQVAMAAPPPPPYDFADAESLVAAWIADVLERRLGIFRLPTTPFPSVAYSHERTFFLFEPDFAPVARRFLTEVLMPACRAPLERHVYRTADAQTLVSPKLLDAFLTEKRPTIWKILIERLGKLAAQHRQAEAKIEAASTPATGGPEFEEVNIPVSKPRVVTVLGVSFRLGKQTVSQRMKVRLRASTELEESEREALTLLARFSDLAGEAGLELPPGCDFQFLRILLEFDAKAFAHTAREIVALAGHKETTRAYLFERLKALDETYANYLSDALILLLFLGGTNDHAFGFKELYDVCIGEARDNSALASRRPFLPAEIGRRPTELVFQLREVLKRRYDEATLTQAVTALFQVWTTMSKTRFGDSLEAGLTVLRTFPVTFAGDLDEPVFSGIGHTLYRVLTSAEPNLEGATQSIQAQYAPILARLRLHKLH
ncbi:MAG: hypothetical protein HQL42_03825 [Alphaproteobacteria bacterium]|nr:hypothetical protein [Alphaproteobacteria bacterium]